jgi:hypothetical protein
MFYKKLLTLHFILSIVYTTSAQEVVKSIPDFTVEKSTVVKLGTSAPIKDLMKRSATSPLKKAAQKRWKKRPDNFLGRRNYSKAVNKELEHQGVDRILQKNYLQKNQNENIPLVNIDGLDDQGSPHDPTGDVSDQYYLQGINATSVGVYSLSGELLDQFSMNTLWAEFGVSSFGDPIILYDENADKWILTEFTRPANILIAVSETGDPMGSYNAYNYSTPNFPDYPKYALTPDALVVTTNEEGAGVLHQYFIDKAGLYAGNNDVPMQRIAVQGNNNTEAGFYVSTPADWNGERLPMDNKPIILALNDSSWEGGPDQDQVELYTYDINFEDESLSTVVQTSIVLSPFDGYPCAVTSGGLFPCIPQLDGGGLDGIPEVVMNVPHQRNFGSHESLVFTFITDVTDGENTAGIRWVELRRTQDSDWSLYQEGTYAPDDGLNRFMASIAIDAKGGIGLGYSVSSENTYAGIRYTGRNASDPLGQMTINEVTVIDGINPINSFSRFGDYPQMSVSPKGDNTFWFTTEYAGDGNSDSKTRIIAFQLSKDTFDLSTRTILNPTTNNPALTATEIVTAEVVNSGLEDMYDFEVGLLIDGTLIERKQVFDTLSEDEAIEVTFDTPVDLSVIQEYAVGAYVFDELDTNPFNDTLFTTIRKIAQLDAAIGGSIDVEECGDFTNAEIRITNNGANVITSAKVQINLNGTAIDTIDYNGSISFEQSVLLTYEVEGLLDGRNEVTYNLFDVNGSGGDELDNNNAILLETTKLPDDSFITFSFLTDEYPEETAWTISTLDSIEVASGFFTEDQEEMLIEEDICLQLDRCYRLLVTDLAADGICCDYGEGSFVILNNMGDSLVSSNGEFAESIELQFCPGERVCMIEVESSVSNASASDAADGSIMIDANNGIAPFQYSIDGGQSFQSDPLFTNLLPGMYTVLVVDADSVCSTSVEVEVSFNTGIVELGEEKVDLRIMPNPNDGIFKLEINHLDIKDHQLMVEIYNQTGQLLQKRKIGKFNDVFKATFSLLDYENGLYFIRIKHPKFNTMERVLKTQ